MFQSCNVQMIELPVCDKIAQVKGTDFLYYDKDGFELNVAEQKYYRAKGYPINDTLNHKCWQEDWFTIQSQSLMFDHCMILHRCSYGGEAREQLMSKASVSPRAQLLLQTRAKWGYDFALDCVSPTGEIYEVIHVEQDSTDFSDFMERKNRFEQIVLSLDWNNVALRVWQNKHEWMHLKGFEQNNWKSKFILGWEKAESIEKCVL
jgi:hypothetical protein